MIKKIGIGVLALVVLLIAAGYFLFLDLDHIIKVTIEKYGTAATQSTVSLTSVTLELSSGDGTLNGLTVANPKGFSTPKAFDLGSVEVKLDTSTVRGTGPIVIRQILVTKPQVTYELLNSGSSNLQAIQKNAEAYASSFQAKQTDSDTTKVSTATADPNKGQPARKVIIDDLIIQGGHISISQELLGGKQLGADLPEIHLTNIGKNSGGATAAQVAEQVFNALTTSAAQAAISELAKAKIGGLINAVPGSAIGGAAVDTIGSKLKGVFSQ